MAEYVMGQDEKADEVARHLLEQAGDRAHEVQYTPRANVHGGAVFVMPDDLAEQIGGERIHRLDNDPLGHKQVEEPTGEPVDPFAHNNGLLDGTVAPQASPATGDNPTYHGVEVTEDGKAVPDEQRTTNKRRRAAANTE